MNSIAAALLPPNLPPDRVAAVFGLISDTHAPERCPALPAALSTIFAGVDLILHAGDLGQLSVLDQLSAIAPIVAVHGNDDTAEVQSELPYQQVIAAASQRIFLCHTHHPDPAEEMAWRQRAGPPGAGLARRAAMGRRAGADIVVYGHSHVPMVLQYDGIWLVNPGAIAPPNPVTRMRRQTVALLYLATDGAAPRVVHIDLAAPDAPFAPAFWTTYDWPSGIHGIWSRFMEPILEPDLVDPWARTWQQLAAAAPEDLRAINALFCRLAYPCWSGEKHHITRTELLDALTSNTPISPTTRGQIIKALATAAPQPSMQRQLK